MTRNRHGAVAREYRKLATSYDTKWAFYVDATVRETLGRLTLPPDVRLLDVACGTGAFLAAVAEAHPDTALAGVDLSPEMLAVARQRLPARAALQVASAEALPFANHSFDVVVTTNAFHFFRAPDAALGEMRRVLRPGGRLAVTDWCDDYLTCRICDRLLRLFDSAHHRIYGSRECRALLEDGEFEAAAVERYKIDWLWGLMTATARKPAQSGRRPDA